MRAILPILWRLGLTLTILLLLASCGIEQSNSAASPPATTTHLPTALAALSITPSPSPGATVHATAPTLALPTISANPTQAVLTVTLADDGKTITLQVGDQFLLDLDINYMWQVSVTDTSIVNPIPDTAGKDDQGRYATYRQGSATLTAAGTPLCYNTVPRCLMPSRAFSLHLNVIAASGPGLTITAADNGETIPLSVGQTFLLNLGQD